MGVIAGAIVAADDQVYTIPTLLPITTDTVDRQSAHYLDSALPKARPKAVHLAWLDFRANEIYEADFELQKSIVDKAFTALSDPDFAVEMKTGGQLSFWLRGRLEKSIQIGATIGIKANGSKFDNYFKAKGQSRQEYVALELKEIDVAAGGNEGFPTRGPIRMSKFFRGGFDVEGYPLVDLQ